MTLLLLTLWCFFSSCSLFQKYTEHQPHSHCSPWFSCLCSLLQEHLTARRHWGVNWSQTHLRDQVALFQWLLPSLRLASSSVVQRLPQKEAVLLSNTCRGSISSPARLPLTCSQLTGRRYPHKSSMGLTTSLVKTGLKRSKSSVSEEQRKQNTERTRSGYMKPDCHSILDVSNIHHFTSTTSPASCTPSSTTTTCQIRHSLLRSEYYGCRKAFTGKHLAQHWCNCKVINNT